MKPEYIAIKMFLKDNALNQYKTVSSGVLMYVKFIYQW